jgi:hypothetical protein
VSGDGEKEEAKGDEGVREGEAHNPMNFHRGRTT